MDDGMVTETRKDEKEKKERKQTFGKISFDREQAQGESKMKRLCIEKGKITVKKEKTSH